MYFGDHHPPNFHTIYQESTAEYDINTLVVLRGTYVQALKRLF
jgi:hypothetical protein